MESFILDNKEIEVLFVEHLKIDLNKIIKNYLNGLRNNNVCFKINY